MVKLWSNGSQMEAKRWSNTGQTVVKLWPKWRSNTGQTVVKLWPKRRSNSGQNEGQTVVIHQQHARATQQGSCRLPCKTAGTLLPCVFPGAGDRV